MFLSGFTDILFAIPVTKSKLKRLTKLADSVDISIMMNHMDIIQERL
jgi:D-serine deaminase-like pyridoxal phosphate-dependent protein